MILRLCELSFLRWQHLGDEWVVFNEGCGETAVADPLTATILMALEPGPLEQNALMALSIAHRGYVLQNGEIVLSDTAERLRKNESVQKAYLGVS